MEVQGVTLGSLTRYIRSMSDDKVLEEHLAAKVKKNWHTYPIPADDLITALAPMQDGFIYGLRSGQVGFICPPASRTIAYFQEPIVGVFAASNYFIAAACSSACRLWSVQREADGPVLDIPSNLQVTCVTGNMYKEVLFLGLSDGSILQYAIKDNDQCLLDKPVVLKVEAREEIAVSEMKTLDSVNWIAARYGKAGGALAVWDHVTRVLVNYFTFTASPGLPRTWKTGETLNLPRFFAPKGSWEVFSDHILLPPKLSFHLCGCVITEISSVSRYAETHGKLPESFSKALESGFAPFITDGALISFTKPNAPKKRPSEKLPFEMELDLGVDFTLVARSEANNYLAFACETGLQVLCLSAVDMEYAHSISGLNKFTKRGFLYTRFGKIFTNDGERLLQLKDRERLLRVSPSWEWALTAITERGNVKKSFIRNAFNGKELTFEGNQVFRVRFSKTSEQLGLILSSGLFIYNLKDLSVVFSDKRDYTKAEARLKLSRGGSFVAMREGKEVVVYSPMDSSYSEMEWTLSRICFLPGSGSEEIIAYSLKRTVRCTLENLDGVSVEEGFERVKGINKGKHCVAYNASGMYVLSASSLTKLIRLPTGSIVICSKSPPTLYSTIHNPSSVLHCQIHVWDLDLGVRKSRVYSGLRHVIDNKLTIRGPGLWGQTSQKLLLRLDTNRVPMKNSWIMNLNSLTSLPAEDILAPKSLNILEESFEMHCLAWKRMAAVLNTNEFSSQLLELVIEPVNLTVLHLLAYKGKAAPLAQAVASGAPILKSSFGSPLSLCIQRKSRKCLNILLSHLVVLREDNPSDFFSVLTQLTDDVGELIRFGSPYLVSFFKQVMVPLPEEFLAPTIISPRAELPIPTLQDKIWVQVDSVKGQNAQEKVSVEYLICPFPVQCTLGGSISLSRMKFLTNDMDDIQLFDTAFIRTYIDMKWNWLWPFILLNTVLYWVLMFALVSRIFSYFDPDIDSTVFLVLNSWFALGELVQAINSLKDYFTDPWNYVDVGRLILGYLWIFTAMHDYHWLTFLLVLLTVIRGITTFKTFDLTRYYVLMIIVVMQKTVSFILIYFYSTLSFGLLFATAHPASFPSFFSIWQMPYDLNMGSFEYSEDQGTWYWFVYMVAALLNVVIMLNLVVSVLGDAFAGFQEIAGAADLFEKADVIYDNEALMFWRRGSDREQFLQVCQEEAGEEVSESAQVKTARQALEVLRGKTTENKSENTEKSGEFGLIMQRIDRLEETISAKFESLVRK